MRNLRSLLPALTVSITPFHLSAETAHAQEAKKLFDVPFTFAKGTSDYSGALTLSPDQQLLAVGESDRAVHLLQFPSGQNVRALPPMAGVPRTVVFAPDGKVLAAHAFVLDEKNSVAGNIVALFDVASGAKLWETAELKRISQMAFWPQTGEFAVAGENSTSVFDAKSGQVKRRLDFEPLSLGSDGKIMLGVGGTPAPKNPGDGNEPLTSILKWNIEAPRVEGKRVGIESRGGFAYSSVKRGALSPDGSRMVAVGPYNAKLFDALTGNFLATYNDVSEYVDFDFSRDGRRLLIPSGFGARVIDAVTGDVLAWPNYPSVAKEANAVFVADLSDDGNILVAAVPSSTSTRTVYAYEFTPDAAGRNSLQVIDTKRARFSAQGSALALSPDGKTLVAAGASLVFLRTNNGARLRSPSGADFAGSVAWSKDGAYLLTGGTSRNTVQLWNAATFSVERTLGMHEWPINAVALSPDGKLAAAGGSGFTGATRPATRGLVTLFDTAKGTGLKTLTTMTGRATALTFSPDGQWLAIGNDDGSLDIWNVAAALASPDPDGGKPAGHLDGASERVTAIIDLKWSATSGLFVARRGGSYGSISLGGGAGEVVSVVSWRNGVAKALRTFRFASDKTQMATAFALAADASRFAVGESTGYDASSTLFVRDAVTGATVASLPVESAVRSLVFSPDGKTLYFQLRNEKGIGKLQKWTFG